MAPADRASQYLFVDGHQDVETALDHLGARYYDSVAGQFLQVDPELVGAKPGATFERIANSPRDLTGYGYALNNPVTLVDRKGRWWETAFDLVSLSLSVQQYRNDPGFFNGLGVAADALAVAVPVVPGGVGVFRASISHADDVADAARLLGQAGDGASFVARAAPMRVLHFTDDIGAEAIAKSGNLRQGTFVTLPPDVPAGSTARQVEELLEIAPGRGQNYIDRIVDPGDLMIPGAEHGGAFTSGGARQFQLLRELEIDPTRFGRTGP